jgi:hypothetical protein
MRGLIVLVLLIGAGLGWIVRPAHIQREAVAAIRGAGGSVFYDREADLLSKPSSRRAWLEWRVDRAGVDYFGNVDGVRLEFANREALLEKIAEKIATRKQHGEKDCPGGPCRGGPPAANSILPILPPSAKIHADSFLHSTSVPAPWLPNPPERSTTM